MNFSHFYVITSYLLQEAKVELSNETQLEILMLVKSGSITQEKAISMARERFKVEKKIKEAVERKEIVQDYNTLLAAIYESRKRNGK